MKITAIILAGGQGKRMGSSCPKQYLMIRNKPVLYYSMRAFESSPAVDDVVLVTGRGESAYVYDNIINPGHFHKVSAVVEGGNERYESVRNGLAAVKGSDYVLIHDGARPFISQAVIARTAEAVVRYDACVVGMPVKDTIKIAGEGNMVAGTPDRNTLWMVQTPQAFRYSIIKEAYDKLFLSSDITVTDDAMAAEQMSGCRIQLIEGSYRNIKITTPEDLLIAEAFAGSEEEYS